MELIGNKNEFAIEFDITDKSQFMGYAKIWLNGNFITTILDYIFFDAYLFNYLDELCRSIELQSYFKEISNEKTFFLLVEKLDNEGEEHNSYKYLCGNYPFSDDITTFAFLENENINILWKARKNPYFHDIKKLENRVYHFEMKKEKFYSLSRQYIEYIKSFLNETISSTISPKIDF